MSLEAELTTLRTRVGLLESSHVEVLRVEGDGAFEALDELIPQRLYLQDAQLTQALLLSDDGQVLADLQVGRDDEAFFLLGEARPGLSTEALVRERLPAGADVVVRNLAPTHAVLSVHGPWAWEFLGEALAPEVVGQPYLSLQHVGAATCFRGGKTGEFGYELLVPRDAVGATLARLREVGRFYELGPLSLAALDHAAFENWFYSVRFEALWPFTPLELQLQWRLWHEKTGYVGAAALTARRQRGVAERLTVLKGAAPLRAGDAVLLDGARVGEVLRAAPLFHGEGHVAWAMLDAPCAVAGLAVRAGDADARTVSPPSVENESLRVDPNKHSFRYGRVPA